MSLYFLKTYSTWASKRELNKVIGKAGGEKIYWRFLRREETVLNSGQRWIEQISRFLRKTEEEAYALIRAEAETSINTAAVECFDGLFIEVEALGRILIKLGRGRARGRE